MHRVFSGILVPLVAWGMICTLVSHLIDLRSLFLAGGEARLRFAVFAFAGGVILIQRLTIEQGNETAGTYKWALGFVMGLFNAWFSASQPADFHPIIVFIVNGLVFIALWWIGYRITAACAVDTDETANAASESGVLRFGKPAREIASPHVKSRSYLRDTRAKRDGRNPNTIPDTAWQQRLPTKHPGRVLFGFALVAIPLFGLGVLLFPRESSLRLGVNLFLFLWCALFLLALSSLRQLDAYVKRRSMTLPDTIGLTWLAIAVSIVTIVVAAGFLLPQPATAPTDFIRSRVFASYNAAQKCFGFKETAAGGREEARGSSGDGPGQKALTDVMADRTKGDREIAGGGKTAYARPTQTPETAATQSLRKMFDFFWRGIGFVTVLAILFVLLVLGIAFWTSIRGHVRRRPKKEKENKRRKKVTPEEAAVLAAIPDPFATGDSDDVNALTERVWQATIAVCAARGAQPSSDQTPYEFLAAKPDALTGIDPEADQLVRHLMHARFSGGALPETVRPWLREYWNQLRQAA